MTAVVAYWPRTGRYECWGAFPSQPDLAQRGENDGVGACTFECVMQAI